VDLREHDIWWHGVAWGQTPGALRVFLPGKLFSCHAGIAILLHPQHSTLLTRRLRDSATLPCTSCTAVCAEFVTWPEHRCKPNTGWKVDTTKECGLSFVQKHDSSQQHSVEAAGISNLARAGAYEL